MTEPICDTKGCGAPATEFENVNSEQYQWCRPCKERNDRELDQVMNLVDAPRDHAEARRG